MLVVQKKVSRYLKEKGWSIVTASEKSGLPIITIKSIIYGKSTNHRVETLVKLAKVFECTIDDLISDNSKTQNLDSDTILFAECLHHIELYLSNKKLSYSKQKVMKAVDSLFSLLIKKKQKNIPYSFDEDIIEWIINNS